jgi:FdhD protein
LTIAGTVARMARRRTERVLVTAWSGVGNPDQASRRRPDELIVEEPMTIQLDGHVAATTMRTPGHDFELAVGWCHTEGLLHGAPITGVRYCANGSASEGAWNVVTVETAGRAPVPTARLGNTTSSCGLCGNEAIDALCDRLAPLAAMAPFDPSVLRDVADGALAGQDLFSRTGAVHAATLFAADGSLLCTREDVGRHNAVDKVIGRMLLDGGLPATGLGMFVSGRASFELVQKAWAAGCSTLLSVSAPTALAVETARRAGLSLVGFVRDDRLNVYAP